MSDTSFPSIIELNVGGRCFTTSLATLTSVPESMLAAMFSGRIPVVTDRAGRYFIDRDGTHFELVLNFLRERRLVLPEGFTGREQLRIEVQFYCLTEMEEALTNYIASPGSQFLDLHLFSFDFSVATSPSVFGLKTMTKPCISLLGNLVHRTRDNTTAFENDEARAAWLASLHGWTLINRHSVDGEVAEGKCRLDAIYTFSAPVGVPRPALPPMPENFHDRVTPSGFGAASQPFLVTLPTS